MSSFEVLILLFIKQLNGERTISSIYHLFKGKKSSQTIQDAHLFTLTQYFGVYQSISRELLEKVIHKALANHLIRPGAEHRYHLTEAGEKLLQISRKNLPPLHYLNGWKYHQMDWRFWERLSLFVQVVSNLVYSEPHYTPIQKNKDTQNWLKSFFNKNQRSRHDLGKSIYFELTDVLQQGADIDPSVFVFRLTGCRTIGLTALQTAEKLGIEFFHYQMEFLNILHYIIRQASNDPIRYPLLSSLLIDQQENEILTRSSQRTYELLNKGYSIDEIATFRRLKKSTIEDHIVEIALNMNSFPIERFVDQKSESSILNAARQTDSKRLKQIKSIVPAAGFFEIRLVLAKHGVKQWN